MPRATLSPSWNRSSASRDNDHGGAFALPPPGGDTMHDPDIKERLIEELEEIRERHLSLDEQLDDYRRRRREYKEQRGSSRPSESAEQRTVRAKPRYNV